MKESSAPVEPFFVSGVYSLSPLDIFIIVVGLFSVGYFLFDIYRGKKGKRETRIDIYKIDKQTAMNITSKQNVTIDNETSVKIYGDGIKNFTGIKFVEYMLMHDKEPYYLAYMANVKDFEKYLPEFEQIVKSFKFVK